MVKGDFEGAHRSAETAGASRATWSGSGKDSPMTALSHLHLRPTEDALLDPLYGSGFRGTDDDAPVGVSRGADGAFRSVDPFTGASGVARIYTPVAVLDDTGIYGSGPLSGRAPQAFDAFGPDADDPAYPAGADWSDVDRLDA